MSPEQEHAVTFKNKFYAARMAFESILFEKELTAPKREDWKKGPLGLAVLILVSSIFLWQWKSRQGDLFSAEEAARVTVVQDYLADYEAEGPAALLGTGSVKGAAAQPPLYYLSYLPVLKFVTSDIGTAVFLVNAFYLALMLSFIYYALRRHRNTLSSLTAAVAAASFPFVLECARSLSPQIATLAFAAGFWCFYLNSEDFDRPKPLFWMGLMFSLGVMTDVFYWVYVLPLLPMMIAVASGHMNRSEMLKGLLPGILAGVPWYLMNAVSFYNAWLARSMAGADLSRWDKFWWLLEASAESMHLPFFLLGAVAMIWMYYSVFMPYIGKEKIVLWFVVPYLFFTLLGLREVEYMYPALLPFAIAVGVMMPSKLRYPAGALAAVLMLINGSGLVGVKYFPGVKLAPLFGSAVVVSGDDFSEKFLSAVRPVAAGRRSPVVCLVGGGEYLNPDTIRVMLSRRGIEGAKVIDSGADLASFCDVLALTPSSSPEAAAAASRIRSASWLGAAFQRAGTISLPAGDTELYHKRRVLPFDQGGGTFRYPSLSIGGLKLRDVVIKTGGFDPASGRYPKADVSSSYASYGEMDIHGFSATAANFSFALEDGKPVILSASPVRLTGGKITDFSVARFLEKSGFPVKDLEVKFGDGMTIFGTMGGKPIEAELEVELKGRKLVVTPRTVRYGSADFEPKYIPLLKYSLDLDDLPLDVRLDSLTIRASIAEIR
ncbi:MAG: glycosyltransferase family 39 protein [Elusimicrobiales bacterium]|nr:glycosyltransferase family 39 protein [Elusimicrobiales bacterium]